MSEDIQGPENQQSQGVSEAQGDAVKKGGPSGEAPAFSSATKVSSMAELQEKAPEVYQAMARGIAMSIIDQMKRAQARLKEKMREMYR